mmetsp:Transcript_43640/g.69092  ORF Transcript_43640/g.69092 Transcript_43640/m.69092 type:complete len:90 (+) Transcript_43640:182-451(+)
MSAYPRDTLKWLLHSISQQRKKTTSPNMSCWRDHEFHHGLFRIEAQNIETLPIVDGLNALFTVECFVTCHADDMLKINPSIVLGFRPSR